MPTLFVFLLKVNIALVVFCLGYYLVLRRLTFYTLNRVYLGVAIIFSTLYPLVNLDGFVQRHQQLTTPVQNVIMLLKTPAGRIVNPIIQQPNYWYWAEVLFWAGAALFALKLFMQLASLYKLYKNSKPGKIQEHEVRIINADISPFSFWQSIYINPENLSPGDLQSIIQHEQVHITEWHTLDILLAEISVIFYWFNPGVWLMKKAVRENIEFITDRKILQKGMDSKTYQYSLLNVSFAPTTSAGITNHFNFSTLKKRIKMMNAKRSSNVNLTRYAFLIPAVVVLLLVFSFTKAELVKNTTYKNIKASIKTNLISIIKPEANKNVLITDAPKKYGFTTVMGSSNKIDTTQSDFFVVKKVSTGTNPKITYNNVVVELKENSDSKNARKIINDTIRKNGEITIGELNKITYGIRIVEPTNTINGIRIDEPTTSTNALTFTKNVPDTGKKLLHDVVITKRIKNGVKDSVTYTINGKKVTEAEFKKIHPNDFGPININGGEVINKAITITGKDGHNLTTWSYTTKDISGGDDIAKTIVIPQVNLPGNDSSKIKEFLGKMQGMEVTSDGTLKHNGQTITKIRINGKPVTVKDFELNKSLFAAKQNADKPTLFTGKLILVDGKESVDSEKIPADKVKSIKIRKATADDTAKYGDKAKNGVVIITTKK